MSTDPTLAAFEARIRGDRTVDPYKLYREINAGIAKRDPRYLGRPLAWQTSMLDRWYKDLTGSGFNESTSFTQRAEADTLYDRLQKASILMETDLWAYEGSSQTAFKQHLFNQFQNYYFRLEVFDEETLSELKLFLLASREIISAKLFAVFLDNIESHLSKRCSRRAV